MNCNDFHFQSDWHSLSFVAFYSHFDIWISNACMFPQDHTLHDCRHLIITHACKWYLNLAHQVISHLKMISTKLGQCKCASFDSIN